MKVEAMILARLEELVRVGDSILDDDIPVNEVDSTLHGLYTADEDESIPESWFVVRQISLARQWNLNCLTALARAFGVEHRYYQHFHGEMHSLRFVDIANSMAFLRAAKEDYEHGMQFDTRTLITAEVFDDFLGQAEHLLEANYYGPAAVVTGAVLEDGLRKLCDRQGIQVDDNATLNTLNQKLYAQQVYDKGTMKLIDLLAERRNNAAHGHWDKFGPPEVEAMLRDVRSFMARYF